MDHFDLDNSQGTYFSLSKEESDNIIIIRQMIKTKNVTTNHFGLSSNIFKKSKKSNKFKSLIIKEYMMNSFMPSQC